MTDRLLEDSIVALQELGMELQGSVEDGVVQQLNEVISKLQLLRGSELELQANKWQMRILFAQAILLIPSIAESVATLVQFVECAASH
jgi:hypothetical protein